MISRAARGPAAVEGVRELVRAIGAIDPALRKELGQRNKKIGQRIIDRAFPKPEGVGAGAGALPRASATTNVLRILSGATTRKPVMIDGKKSWVQQWGKKYKDRDVKRPYIRRSAEKMMPEIERDYMDALLTVAREAGIQTERG